MANIDGHKRDSSRVPRTDEAAALLPSTRTAVGNVVPFVELRDVVLDEQLYQQLLATLRLEPYFKLLPASQEENPALYDAVETLLRECIQGGSLTLYSDGTNIHHEDKADPRKNGKPGQLQVVLAGELQMEHSRYSRQLDALREVGFDGPQYFPGMTLASWAMAGKTGSHFAEIVAQGSVLTFAMTGSQYERLIRLTLTDERFSHSTRTISDQEVEALRSVKGLLKQYGDDTDLSDILVVERYRDYKKRGKEPDHRPCAKIWSKYDLAEVDFVVKVNGAWHTYKHTIQNAIKRSTINQHIFDKNFCADPDSVRGSQSSARCFKFQPTAEEHLALSRNTTSIDSDRVSLEGADIDSTILLAVLRCEDVEKPDHPLLPGGQTIPGTLEVSYQDGDKEGVIQADLPRHGAVDPITILAQLRDQGIVSSAGQITGISVKASKEVQLLKLDVSGYRTEVSGAYRYSIDRFLNDLRNLNYTIAPHDERELREVFEAAVQTFEKLLAPQEGRTLSNEARLDCLNVLGSWLGRDSFDRKDPSKPTPVSADRLASIRDAFSHAFAFRETLSQTEVDRQAFVDQVEAFLSKPPPSTDTAAKLTTANSKRDYLVALDAVAPDVVKLVSPEVMRTLNYREAKFVYGHNSDAQLRKLKAFDRLFEGPYAETERLTAACARMTFVIPDMHEDLGGMRTLVEAIGVDITSEGIDLSLLRGKTLNFAGDALNRNVGALGVDNLRLIQGIQKSADEFNRTLPPNHDDRIEVGCLIGNHELDLIRMSDDQLRKAFPQLGRYTIARYCRDAVVQMIKNGQMVAALHQVGASGAELVSFHSLMLPQFKMAMAQELRDKGIAPSSKAIIDHCNKVLKDAVENRDFGHPLFFKSKDRGGKDPYSGPIEADANPWPTSDITKYVAEIKGTTSATSMKTHLEEALGNQVVGHNFNPNATIPRKLHVGGEELPGIDIPTVWVTDAANVQVATPDPTAGIVATALVPPGKAGIEPGVYTIRPTFMPRPPRVRGEPAVTTLYQKAQRDGTLAK